MWKPITGRREWFINVVGREKYLHNRPWGRSKCEMIYEKEYAN